MFSARKVNDARCNVLSPEFYTERIQLTNAVTAEPKRTGPSLDTTLSHFYPPTNSQPLQGES